jgi:hypothetical protein
MICKKKGKVIGDGDDLPQDRQDMDIGFDSYWGGERIVTGIQRNLSFGQYWQQQHHVDTILAALVENSDKSVGGAPKSVGAPVEDTTAATEDTAAADFLHHLVKHRGKTANFWDFYKLYDPTHHPDLQDVAHCMPCHTNISTKGHTTSGLNKHLQHRHHEEYESMNERCPSCMSAETEWQPSVAGIFPRKAKDKSIADIKMEYIHAVTNFLGWEFQFLVPISGTPIGSRILLPFLIPKILVGKFFSNSAVEKLRNRISDSEIQNSKKNKRRKSIHLISHMLSIVIGQPVGLMVPHHMDVGTIPGKGNISAYSTSTQLDYIITFVG